MEGTSLHAVECPLLWAVHCKETTGKTTSFLPVLAGCVPLKQDSFVSMPLGSQSPGAQGSKTEPVLSR